MIEGWVDSHAHLNLLPEDDHAAALERAAAAGVSMVLVPSTGGGDLEPTLRLGREHPARVVVAAGVHPHEASSLDAALRRRLTQALTAPGVVAVGEIGLDYHYLYSPREDQLRALDWQLDLALAHDLPVVLHNRESFADMEALLGRRAGPLRGVCHSFSEGAAAASRVVDLGLYVGISGMVTFRRAEEVRAAARVVPGDRLLVETDSPYLAPEPFRGRRNEPALIPYVGRRLAQERAVVEADLAASTSANFAGLFLATTAAPSGDGHGGAERS